MKLSELHRTLVLGCRSPETGAEDAVGCRSCGCSRLKGGEGIFQLQYLPEEVSRLSLQVPVLNYLLRLLDAVINRRHATLSCYLPKGTRTLLDLQQAGPKDTIYVLLCFSPSVSPYG